MTIDNIVDQTLVSLTECPPETRFYKSIIKEACLKSAKLALELKLEEYAKKP